MKKVTRIFEDCRIALQIKQLPTIVGCPITWMQLIRGIRGHLIFNHGFHERHG